MAFIRIKWHGIAGCIVIAIFIILLGWRLDLFPSFLASDATLPPDRTDKNDDQDDWMQILQNGRKIGYAHRILASKPDGYAFTDDVFMRINAMGVVQGFTLSSQGTLNRDLTLSTFKVRLSSNMFRFAARGHCDGKNLSLYMGEGAEEKRYDLVLKDPPYMTGNVVEAAFKSGLRDGEAMIFQIFDPASMGMRPVKVSRSGEEIRSREGKPQKLTKWSIDFMGARQWAWLDVQGRIMREEGMLGMVLERASREAAMQGLSAQEAGADMTELASVASNRTIPEPSVLSRLKIKVTRIEANRFALDGGRQSFRNDLLTIEREVPAPKSPPPDPPLDKGTRNLFLRSTPFVQADHPDIRAVLTRIVAPQDTSGEKMKKITRWVYRYLEKQPVLSVSNAVETLTQKKGDCTEHAVLVAALGRAAGIPTTIETGLVYQRGRFYYHAWNVFLIEEWNQWITADAVFDQIPADVTHIRFVRGEAQEQLDLVGLLGRVKLEIIE